jgi:hypothetical protein
MSEAFGVLGFRKEIVTKKEICRLKIIQYLNTIDDTFLWTFEQFVVPSWNVKWCKPWILC